MGEGNRPLKILHVDPEREWGGGETQVFYLLKQLSLRGHQNHLLGHPEGTLSREAQRIGITTFSIRARNDVDLRPVIPLRRLIRREQYDIVHFHTKRAHAQCLWLGRVYQGVRHVVTRRMDYPVKRNWYNDWIYNRQVDGVVAISEKIAELLVEGGVRKERIRVIHSGIDPAPFQRSREGKQGSGHPVIGMVAVLEERKGHRFLLEAAQYLKRQGYRLRYYLAGEGTQRRHIEQAVMRLGLQEEVALMGFVSDIPSLLSEMDVFVLPSVHEGLGVAVIEAMAAGKPVVASRVGGLPELVENKVTGLLVPPGDPLALARAISHLVTQKEGLESMGIKARERVEQHFTMEQMAKKNEDFYYDLLQDCLHPHPSPSP
ncbi:MAG: glycosyltransferase family 4 protein [Candidatus Binatia bacterium]